MITKNIKVPTGNICVMKGEKGLIEFLSIGDYGKNSNIKVDFLGITRKLNGVPMSSIGGNGLWYGLVKADHYRPIEEINFKQPLLTIPIVVGM